MYWLQKGNGRAEAGVCAVVDLRRKADASCSSACTRPSGLQHKRNSMCQLSICQMCLVCEPYNMFGVDD